MLSYPSTNSLSSRTADIKDVLISLAKETKTKGWWHAYGDVIPDWFELYVGLETAATRLRKYEPLLTARPGETSLLADLARRRVSCRCGRGATHSSHGRLRRTRR